MRWGFVPIGTNPFGNRLIRIDDASKCLKKGRSLTVEQFHQLLRHKLLAKEPFQTMVIAAICLGLRCSELFALKWSDIEWDNLAINIRRGFVRGEFDRPKSDSSEAPVPLAAQLAEILWHWGLQSPFNQPDDFVFANPLKAGKVPYAPEGIQKNRIAPAAKDVGLGDGIGWHTFRHTYRTLLDETGAPLTVQQKLMRHADARMTLKYGEALDDSKRKANKKVVTLVLTKSKKGAR